MNLDAQLAAMRRAMNATPAERAALRELAVGLAAPPPCPDCGRPMGDGDRVTYGRCVLCRRRRAR